MIGGRHGIGEVYACSHHTLGFALFGMRQPESDLPLWHPVKFPYLSDYPEKRYMRKAATKAVVTPVYALDSFSEKARENSFYIETLTGHVEAHEFVSRPHRHDFYLVLYITKGGGEHTIDFTTYTVQPRSFFVMTPGQVHSWKLRPDTEGYILLFTPAFYETGTTERHLVEFPFFHSLNPGALIQLKADDAPIAYVILEEMLREYKAPASLDLRLLRSYLDVVLLNLARYNKAERAQEETTQLTATFKLRKLEELINQHYRMLRQPHEYAELMNLSASYLNTLCKQNLGKTLSDLIHERVILEAKRFFAFSDLTVNQVADALHFTEASYFIRFYKKQTGFTPEQFREQLNRTI